MTSRRGGRGGSGSPMPVRRNENLSVRSVQHSKRVYYPLNSLLSVLLVPVAVEAAAELLDEPEPFELLSL